MFLRSRLYFYTYIDIARQLVQSTAHSCTPSAIVDLRRRVNMQSPVRDRQTSPSLGLYFFDYWRCLAVVNGHWALEDVHTHRNTLPELEKYGLQFLKNRTSVVENAHQIFCPAARKKSVLTHFHLPESVRVFSPFPSTFIARSMEFGSDLMPSYYPRLQAAIRCAYPLR